MKIFILIFFKGENRTPEQLDINPAGSLPYITVDEKPVYESASILRFLAQQYPSLAEYYPADLFIRAKIDAALDFNGTLLRPNLLMSFIPRVFSKDGNVDDFT